MKKIILSIGVSILFASNILATDSQLPILNKTQATRLIEVVSQPNNPAYNRLIKKLNTDELCLPSLLKKYPNIFQVDNSDDLQYWLGPLLLIATCYFTGKEIDHMRDHAHMCEESINHLTKIQVRLSLLSFHMMQYIAGCYYGNTTHERLTLTIVVFGACTIHALYEFFGKRADLDYQSYQSLFHNKKFIIPLIIQACIAITCPIITNCWEYKNRIRSAHDFVDHLDQLVAQYPILKQFLLEERLIEEHNC